MRKGFFQGVLVGVSLATLGFTLMSVSAAAADDESSRTPQGTQTEDLSKLLKNIASQIRLLERAVVRLEGSVGALKGGADVIVIDERMCPSRGDRQPMTFTELLVRLNRLQKAVDRVHADNIEYLSRPRFNSNRSNY
jgi:hypothetical protein